MAKRRQRLYIKREFDVALNEWLLWCSCILVLDQIYKLYNLMSIELITALREVKKLARAL